MDTLTAAERSQVMKRVRSKDTRPELQVRSLVHRMGYRFRLHRKDLPGTPDLAFPRLGKIIFVHGCFWHGHNCRAGRNRPSSNATYWRNKLDRNRSRDQRNRRSLREAGWRVMVVWECQLRDYSLESRLRRFLETRHD